MSFVVLMTSIDEAWAQSPPTSSAHPAGAAHDPAALARTVQNPIGDLVSVPLQFNFTNGGDISDRTLFNLNLQPVVPIRVTERWNVIARAIVPFFSNPLPDERREDGIGDIQLELFFTPAQSTSFVWGIGPALSLPTATADAIRSGSWAAGPAVVAVLTQGAWVTGLLATQEWTFADTGDDREVDQLLLQPFINFNFGRGWAVTTAPMITANWQAESDNTWTVPLGGGLTWTTHVGHQAMNLGAQYYRNVVYPDGAGANLIRLNVSFLFPNAPPKAPAPAAASR